MKKKNSSITYIVLFVLVIVMMGIASFKNLVKFYVNDEVDYNEWSVDLGNKFETDVATTFWKKFEFVNINGAFRKLFGQQEMNGVVKLNNGYLLTTIDYVDDETLQAYAKNVAALNSYLKSRGTNLLYVMTPYTSGKYNPQIPEGVLDFGNDDADRLVSYMQSMDIDTIDLRDTMYEDGIDHYDMMYKTDHHWNTAAGLYAYRHLESYIKEKTGCEVDSRISDISNYQITTYKKWHLGSRGQRTGRYFAGIDDFELYIPNFKTTIQSADGTTGTMQDLVINMDPLLKHDYTSRYTYDWVLDNSLDHFINLDCKNDIKILIVTDSFGKVVNPYLIMGFSEVEYIYDGEVARITPDYIEEYNPNIVILMYYAENAMCAGAYNFQGFN